MVDVEAGSCSPGDSFMVNSTRYLRHVFQSFVDIRKHHMKAGIENRMWVIVPLGLRHMLAVISLMKRGLDRSDGCRRYTNWQKWRKMETVVTKGQGNDVDQGQ